jgi:hypothetical protein
LRKKINYILVGSESFPLTLSRTILAIFVHFICLANHRYISLSYWNNFNLFLFIVFAGPSKDIAVYLLKARTVEPEKQPLLGNSYITTMEQLLENGQKQINLRS